MQFKEKEEIDYTNPPSSPFRTPRGRGPPPLLLYLIEFKEKEDSPSPVFSLVELKEQGEAHPSLFLHQVEINKFPQEDDSPSLLTLGFRQEDASPPSSRHSRTQRRKRRRPSPGLLCLVEFQEEENSPPPFFCT